MPVRSCIVRLVGVVAKNDAERMLNWVYDPILTALPIG